MGKYVDFRTVHINNTFPYALTKLWLGLIHGYENTSDFQRWVKFGLYGSNQFQHLRDTLARQKMCLHRDDAVIRCGKCVAACPMHLEPLFMYQYASKGMVDELNDAHIMDCMECGACAYACPARMHLTHMFKVGKQKLKDKMAADKAAAEAAKAAAEKKEA